MRYMTTTSVGEATEKTEKYQKCKMKNKTFPFPVTYWVYH